MRYLGNKTRLVPFLLRTVDELALEPGIACDPFAGTASVGRALKGRGWRVHSGDLLALSHALQTARVALDRTPRFPGPTLGGGGSVSYRSVLAALGSLDPRPGFVHEHYSPGGGEGARHGRMYFTPANAARIDTVRDTIGAWRAEGRIDGVRARLLLATLIQAADRVANTTGVYASFVKTWQPNARKPLELRPLVPQPPRDGLPGGCTARRAAARETVAAVGTVDLLYLDPPYNERQYPAYYHLPELIARGWDPPPPLRGKTGLIPDDALRSDWCRRGKCEEALRALLEAADARHILLSYNDEGLLPAERIEALLREAGDPDSYRRFGKGYRRYRSDSDRPGRRYAGDRVRERVHYVRRP